jgi:hypothetical protein
MQPESTCQSTNSDEAIDLFHMIHTPLPGVFPEGFLLLAETALQEIIGEQTKQRDKAIEAGMHIEAEVAETSISLLRHVSILINSVEEPVLNEVQQAAVRSMVGAIASSSRFAPSRSPTGEKYFAVLPIATYINGCKG